jgi:CMP-N-acetylneuraminic acid synthetase
VIKERSRDAVVLGIIPARGGSKGIPKKNIAPLCERPLLAYTIEAALESNLLDHVILSTDCSEIAYCAKAHGLQVDDLRPRELATDEVATIDVVRYELAQFERRHKTRAEIVVILQPTAPMRTVQDINSAINQFIADACVSMTSVYRETAIHPLVMYYARKRRLVPVLAEAILPKRRQDFPSVFVRNGALYISRRKHVLEEPTLLEESPHFYEMPWERSINIDEPFDLRLAEWLMSRNETN